MGLADGDEEAFAAGQYCSVGELELSLMEELATGGAVGFGGTLEMSAYEDQWLIEWCGAEVVDLHVAGHGEDVERTVEFAHGFVQQGGDDAAVDVAGRALVNASELKVGGGSGVDRVCRVRGEDEVKALRIGWAAAEAVFATLVESGDADGGVAGGGHTSDGIWVW